MQRVMWTTIAVLLLAASAVARPPDNEIEAPRDRASEVQSPRDRSGELQMPRSADAAPTPR